MLTPHQRTLIPVLHRRGYSQRMIAAELGCHQTTVGRIIRELGLVPNGFAHPQAKLRRSEATRLLCLRKGVKSLAQLNANRGGEAEQKCYRSFVSRHGGYDLWELKRLRNGVVPC